MARDPAEVDTSLAAVFDELEVRLTATSNRQRRPRANDRIDAIGGVGRDIDAVADAIARILGPEPGDNR